MRAFITGATGFIGGRVAKALVERGDEVTALVRSPDKAGALRGLGVTLVGGDITEPSTLQGPIRRAEAVYHLAAWYEVGVTDRTRMYQINVRGTEHVMDAAAAAGVERVVYCSSVVVFGMRSIGDIADETTEHEGGFGSLYEETKWQAHMKVRERARAGLPVITVMPGGVFGPGDQSPIAILLRLYSKGWLIAVPFPQTEFSFIQVDDLADGFLAAFDKGRPGEEYVLGGENLSIREVFLRLEPITGIRPPRFGVPSWLVRASIPISPLIARALKQGPHVMQDAMGTMGGSFMASSAKAQRELGFAFRSLEDTMPETIEWLKEH
jgi:nucleoside-diphosphate-sugar epimerase